MTDSAKRLVAVAPERPHPLTRVARILGASPHHLAHVFRAHAGVPFHRFILDLRIAIALSRLSRREVHLSSLALDLGFATHSHFTAAFRRALGVPPSRIRRVLDACDLPLADAYDPDLHSDGGSRRPRSDTVTNAVRIPSLVGE
ncbi:MAG: helix-turn-helix transcriptional regulator [Gemmatimonadaceae bacterium]